MTTFASLFSGAGGVDAGAIAAGLEPIFGVEYDPRIAEVARANLPHEITVADILTLDPKRFERPDILHASPPCPSFSIARNAHDRKGETAHDIAMSEKVAEFVRVLEPQVFTLENVTAYARSKSWQAIESTLLELGYWLHVAFVDAADFGVPQHRRRMIVRAMRGEMVPPLPTKVPHVGWYEAIEDLLPDLPESEFAPWQLERLERMGVLPESFIIGQGTYSAPIAPSEPMDTITANINQASMRALLFQQHLKCKGIDEASPVGTITASTNQAYTRALLQSGRVVRISTLALARFQSFPDSFILPDTNTLACRVIGNAVPPRLMQRIYEGLIS